MVGLENGESLGGRGAGVVAALGGLDGVAAGGRGTAGGGGKGAFAVGGCGLEGGGCEGQGEGEGEESCEEHGCVFCVDVWVGLRA